MRQNHFLAHKNAEKNCILPTIFTKIENVIREMGTAGQRLSYIPIDWLLNGWIQRIIRKKYGFKKLPMNDVFCLLR